MCGRFTLKSNLADWIGDLFEDSVSNVPSHILPGYNIAPTQHVWTISCLAEPSKLECVKMFWGLLPAWVKSKSEGAKLINARSETILEKPTFRKIIQTNRCFVPADGYYEWKKLVDGTKQPYWITRADEKPFVFAAIYQPNKFLTTEPEKPLLSVSILTTHATSEYAHLHDRMPLMLFHKDQRQRWLNEEQFDEKQMQEFARPPAAVELRAIPVSTKVNNAHNQGPELIEPVQPDN